MAVDTAPFYDPSAAQWPDTLRGRVVLAPVRVGMDRKTGKMLVGWPHVQQSISVIFSTRFHTRVLRRWVGSFVPHLLGENGTVKDVTRFYWSIAGALDLWEPNYRLSSVKLAPSETDTQFDQFVGTDIDNFRLGHMTVQHFGTYRPRAHLGDPTPEDRRGALLQGDGSQWRATA